MIEAVECVHTVPPSGVDGLTLALDWSQLTHISKTLLGSTGGAVKESQPIGLTA
jgi:hypothetical protein